MKIKIFKNMALLSLLMLALCFFVSMHGFHQQFSRESMENLKTQAAILTAQVQQTKREKLQELSEQNEMQIIWISRAGEVLYSSDGLDGKAEEITDQPEVKAAIQTGEGSGIHPMKNAFKQMSSYAFRLEDGSILQVSKVQDTLFFLAVQRIWLMLILAILAVFVSFWLAGRITRSVMHPLNEARLEDLEMQSVCQELRPLATRMLDQNRQMQKQLDKQYNKLKREYEKQDRMRRDFTANVSHELKTPLTSISGYAEIIRNGMVKEEDVSRFAGKIYDETQRLITLVGDILKLSQLEVGHQMNIKRVPIDLYATCERMIATLQAAAQERGIIFSLNGDHWKIIGAEQILDEIVYNLCDNAVKYNKENGQITVSVTEQEGKVVLSIQDTGIGISKEEQERVFERFYRVDQSHSKEIGGTGLGLSIVKHAALYHDAKIWISSSPGEGTEIRILFHKQEMQ